MLKILYLIFWILLNMVLHCRFGLVVNSFEFWLLQVGMFFISFLVDELNDRLDL